MSLRSRKRRQRLRAAVERVRVQLGLERWPHRRAEHGGRTTRMLCTALAVAMLGRDVVLVAHNARFAEDLSSRWHDMAERVGVDHRRLRLATYTARADQVTRGLDAAVFVDHHAADHRAAMLDSGVRVTLTQGTFVLADRYRGVHR